MLKSDYNAAFAAGNFTEAAILVDTQAAITAESKKSASRRRSAAEVEAAIRNVYAGNNPYLAGPVEVAVIG